MRLIIFGPPGSGKGTYASRLSPIFNIPHISTGQILRDARNDQKYGTIIKECQEKGELVPIDIVVEMLKKKLSEPDCKNGFILDGYPRNVEQAKKISDIPIDFIINLVVSDDIIIKRLSSRRQCDKCGEIYNILYLKPKEEGKCDKCGGNLIQRDDDKEDVIKERLKIYEEETRPVLDYYKRKVKIIDIECRDINASPDFMVEKILTALRKEGVKV